MRTEDLQREDWLYYKGRFNAFPFQVEQITRKKIGYHAEPNENRIYYLRASECSPLPLTPMTLANNGFKEYEPDHYRWDYADGVYINADFVAEEPFVAIHNKSYYAVPVCNYLHELQHALKLCGINKEITL
jgi:hypothetical protein